MLSINCAYTLANVVIVDPILIYLVSWVFFSCGVVAIIVVQAKDRLYYNRFQIDMFLPLAIKVFGCG